MTRWLLRKLQWFTPKKLAAETSAAATDNIFERLKDLKVKPNSKESASVPDVNKVVTGKDRETKRVDKPSSSSTGTPKSLKTLKRIQDRTVGTSVDNKTTAITPPSSAKKSVSLIRNKRRKSISRERLAKLAVETSKSECDSTDASSGKNAEENEVSPSAAKKMKQELEAGMDTNLEAGMDTNNLSTDLM